MIAEGRALKKSKTIVPNKLVKKMMIFSLDAAYSLRKEVSYPDFSNSKTYQKVKKAWDNRRFEWQEKAIRKDQETSVTINGAETTTPSLG